MVRVEETETVRLVLLSAGDVRGDRRKAGNRLRAWQDLYPWAQCGPPR